MKFFSSTCQPFWYCSVRKKFQKWGKLCGFPKLNFWQISAYCMQPWTRTHYSDDAKTIHKAEQNCPLWLIKGIHQESCGVVLKVHISISKPAKVGFNFSFYVGNTYLCIYLSFSISQVTFFTPTSSSTMGAMHSYRNWVNGNCTVAHFLKSYFPHLDQCTV